jgi:uncharacterized protein (DUF1919 family)
MLLCFNLISKLPEFAPQYAIKPKKTETRGKRIGSNRSILSCHFAARLLLILSDLTETVEIQLINLFLFESCYQKYPHNADFFLRLGLTIY